MNKNCKFCKIINNAENLKKKILFQDEKVIMFSDYRPICEVHLQCIPKIHIKNINSLTKEHIPLLLHMKEVAKKFLIDSYKAKENEIVMGFHIPPWNSVDHLHMHCMKPPFKNERTRSYNCDLIMIKIDKEIEALENNNNLNKNAK